MGCESLYRLWNSHLARKGIIQFAALVLISQVEWAYLPVAGYLRQMDSRAAQLSLDRTPLRITITIAEHI